jgi:hypothetical protein
VHERVAAPYADALVSGDVMCSAIQVHRPERNSVFCADADRARESRLQLLNRAADACDGVRRALRADVGGQRDALGRRLRMALRRAAGAVTIRRRPSPA